MASRQSMSSILKPPKVRAPLKEIEPVDQDSDENTATSSKRKVSFSGMNKIKMYNTCATSLTVNQAPMFDEKISISSDSLNGDKTKLSGKFEKSDGQITFESTDCTNIEDNGRVIIEYESPSDNMEMTEAKVGELHDSMFLIGNYDSECMNSSNLDDSETNMEFTEAIKVGRIITVDMESDFSSTELSETMHSEHEEQLSHKPIQSSDDIPKMISNKSLNSSCMEFTCTSTKVINSAGIDVSNTEFTCTTVKSQKSALNDDYKSFSMELTQVPDRLTSENCNDFIYESSIDDTSYESKNNSNCAFENEQNVFTKTPVIDNDIMVCHFKNVDCSEDNALKLSLGTTLMDIDRTLECNEYEKNDIVVDYSELVVNKQNCSSIETPMEVEIVRHSINSELNNSNIIEIYHQNNQSTVSMNPTGSSFVESMSPEKNINKSLEAEQPLNQSLNAHAISIFDPNQYLLKEKSLIVEENQLRKYSRKTMIHSAPLNVEIDLEKFTEHFDMSIEAQESQINKSSTVPLSDFKQSLSFENEYSSDNSAINEEIQQKLCSRKSIASMHVANEMQSFYENEDLPDKSTTGEKSYSRKSVSSKSVFNQSQSNEIEDVFDKSTAIEENQQKKCSRKSIVPTNMANEMESFYENEDLSDKSAVDEENRQKYYSRKSVSSKSVFNQSQSHEIEDVFDKSTAIEENQQKKCSRKSIVPTNMANEMESFYENEDLSDKSAVDEENRQKNYSRKSVSSKSVFNQSQSHEIEDVFDKSTAIEENQQKKCSRKSIAPTNMANEMESFYENENLSDKSTVDEEHHQKNYSRKSDSSKSDFNQSQSYEIEDVFDKSTAIEENQQKKCSRKSIAPTNMANELESFYENEDLSDKSAVDEENRQKNYSRKSVSSKSVFNQSQSHEIEDVFDKSTAIEENQQKKCSRKSIAPTNMANEMESFYENENLSDKSTVDEEHHQKNYSRKSDSSKSDFNQSQSYEIEDVFDKSTTIEENQQKRCSRKSIAPTNMADDMQSFYENEDLSDKSAVNEESLQKNYSRKSDSSKSDFNQSQSYEIEDVFDKSTTIEENQQKRCSRKSIAPTNMADDMQSFYENEDLSDKSAVNEESLQKNYSRKSVTSKSVFNQNQSCVIKDLSNKADVDEENQQKLCSDKSMALMSISNECTQDTSEEHLESEQKRRSTASIASDQLVHDQSCSFKNGNISNTSMTVDDNVQKRYSRKSIGPNSFYTKALEGDLSENLLLNVESNTSHVFSNSDEKPLDSSNYYEENSTQKIENQSAMFNVISSVISDDDLNSPFRKKSKKSIVLSNLINEHVKQTLSPLNDQEKLLETTGNKSENGEYESEMDISIEYESKTGSVANTSSQKISTSKKNIKAPSEFEKNEADLNELAENHKFIYNIDDKSKDKTNDESTKIIDDDKSNQAFNSKDPSFSYDIDRVTNTICVEGMSNMSITDEKFDRFEKSEEKTSLGNRKRSYSNRDCVPLSCSSFVSNSNVENCVDKDNIKTEIIKESPIKIDDAIENTINDSVMMNMNDEDFSEKESFKENLSNEVLEFLTRWTKQFVEKKLSLDKCTNKEWIFNILDSSIKLIISYSSISNDLSFLKVENISFTTNIIPQDEIMKFGVNWILSKYNPKVYKQICYTSRDVELLLKCLLEDVQFISKMMKNMTLVRDIHFVTFKDNKAVVVLHKMIPPLMVRFEIMLSNIHRISVKDITYDCIFGSFNKKLLDEALENINQDFKVLQSFIEKLRALAL